MMAIALTKPSTTPAQESLQLERRKININNKEKEITV